MWKEGPSDPPIMRPPFFKLCVNVGHRIMSPIERENRKRGSDFTVTGWKKSHFEV